MNAHLEEMLESMQEEIGCELSEREEGVFQGHMIVCEQVYVHDSRTCRFLVDGEEVKYDEIESKCN